MEISSRLFLYLAASKIWFKMSVSSQDIETKTIFKMAAGRHLEFCRKSQFMPKVHMISHYLANAKCGTDIPIRGFGLKIFNMAAVRHLHVLP